MLLACIMSKVLLIAVVLICGLKFASATPVSSPNWEEQISDDGVKFTGRNAHASCLFQGKIWLTGGKTAEYVMWNLQDSYQVGDVWHTNEDLPNRWVQENLLTGDYFAQNTEVVQPGPIAPWYQRYGHTMNALDVDGDGDDDLMILMGGYSPAPSNDVWVTTNGTNWVYAGHAPWSKRAWQSTVVFQGKLHMMGGTPLNNEVWRLNNITKIPRIAPLTRSTYMDHTYELNWQRLADAPWSPRVGAGLVSHWYFNTSAGQTLAQSKERIVLVGGYGGYPPIDPYLDETSTKKYDGFVTRPDTWDTFDGENWRQLNWNNTFGGRAWMGIDVLTDDDVRKPYPNTGVVEPPKMYIFGGGYIGYRTNSKKRVTAMQGKADGYWSKDGANWVKINYEEGGGTSTVPFFSSQEWTTTIVDTATKYLGRWGLTVHAYNVATHKKAKGKFFLIAGDFTGGGEYANSVYSSLSGIFCDIGGYICGGHGTCGSNGCVCNVGWTGPYCTTSTGPVHGNTAAGSVRQLARASALLGAVLSVVVFFL